MRGRGLRGCCGNSSSKPANIFPTINAGTFRQRIEIQTPTLVPDNRGGGVYNWSTIASVYARVETVDKASYVGYVNWERFEEGQLLGRKNYIITIRYGTPVTTDMRVIYNGKNLEIQSVINVDELNWMVMMYCKELGKGVP